MPMSYHQLKERYKAQILYHVNKYQVTYINTCFQCGLNTLLNLPFKATLFIYKFILNTNKWCLVFATSNFILNMIFSSMLPIFELCQQKQGSYLFTYGQFLSAISYVLLKIWNSYFVCPLEIP
jgi:hypothetical protein